MEVEDDNDVGAVEAEGVEEDAIELIVGDFFKDDRRGAGAREEDATVIDDVEDVIDPARWI